MTVKEKPMFKKILIANRGEISLARDSRLPRSGHSKRLRFTPMPIEIRLPVVLGR